MLGTAPRLADILAQHPQVMDALIDPSFFGALPDEARARAPSSTRSLGAGAHATRTFSTACACSARSTCS